MQASEPVEDVQQLSAAVMREVQQYSTAQYSTVEGVVPNPNPNPNPNPDQVQQYKRSVIVTGDGAVEPMDFMVTDEPPSRPAAAAPTLRPLVATAP